MSGAVTAVAGRPAALWPAESDPTRAVAPPAVAPAARARARLRAGDPTPLRRLVLLAELARADDATGASVGRLLEDVAALLAAESALVLLERGPPGADPPLGVALAVGGELGAREACCAVARSALCTARPCAGATPLGAVALGLPLATPHDPPGPRRLPGRPRGALVLVGRGLLDDLERAGAGALDHLAAFARALGLLVGRDPAPAPRPAPRGAAQPRAPAPRRVLLALEDPERRAAARQALARQGVGVLEVQDGFEVLEALGAQVGWPEAWRPDVIAVDARLPVMDGLEALGEVRRFHPGVRALVLADPEDRDARTRAAALACEVLDRTLRPEDLAVHAADPG